MTTNMEDSDALAATLAAKQKELDELDEQIKSSNTSKEPRSRPPPSPRALPRQAPLCFFPLSLLAQHSDAPTCEQAAVRVDCGNTW